MPEVRLLGRPRILRDGQPVAAPRGHKSWILLAYLLLAEAPVSRSRLAELLFAEADDPLGALRWTLAQLRRALGVRGLLAGDPLRLELPAVDVLDLIGGTLDPSRLGGELLEGVEADGLLQTWLVIERRRVSGICEDVLHESALEALTAGRPLDGAALASRALTLDPFDESVHELLVRCLARAGQLGAARHHANACEVLFRRELGRSPDPRVRRAADDDLTPGEGDRAAAEGQLAAGKAAIVAGATEPGIACLRHAAAEARGVGDPQLLARTLAALGEALVHAVRGRDEEGAAVLHESLALHETAAVCRELGFVEVQAGRATSAGRWLQRAVGLATGDAERAAVLGVRGMALSDRARYEAAIALLRESVALGAPRQAAWSSGILGRALLLRGDVAEAGEALDRSLALVEAEGWVAFQPFPEALRAEVALHFGDQDHAGALVDHAFSLGCRLGDPCWEALAARARGLVLAAAGERDAALASLRDAVARSIRVADPYVWVHAHCLDALAEAAIDAPDAAEVVGTLERVAARANLRELVARAARHRGRLGDPWGFAIARLIAAEIDNPALRRHTRAHTVG